MLLIKRKVCLLWAGLIISATVTGQQKKKFYNIDEGGIQFSDSKGAVVHIIGGYNVTDQLQAGVGVGLDDYKIRSLPVFGDVRYNFTKKKNTFFAYSGAGVAFPWPTHSQYPYPFSDKAPDKNTGGLYAHAGIGYKINGDFHIAVGYSHAAMKLKYSMYDSPDYISYENSFNRITIVAGFTL